VAVVVIPGGSVPLALRPGAGVVSAPPLAAATSLGPVGRGLGDGACTWWVRPRAGGPCCGGSAWWSPACGVLVQTSCGRPTRRQWDALGLGAALVLLPALL